MEDRRGGGLVTCGKGVGLNCFISLPFLMCGWSVDIKESVWGVGFGLEGSFSVCLSTQGKGATARRGIQARGHSVETGHHYHVMCIMYLQTGHVL